MATRQPASTARDKVRTLAPKLVDLTEKVLFGDVWERPGLSKRDRSLITVAMLTALYRHEQLPGHVNRALDNGVTKEELARRGDRQEGLRVARSLMSLAELVSPRGSGVGWPRSSKRGAALLLSAKSALDPGPAGAHQFRERH